MRHIDHIVIAARELDEAGDFYCRLGFQVGARNRHPWGTENRLVQFGSSFIELITVAKNAVIPPFEERKFSFGAFVDNYLNRREGLAMLALDSADATADAALFAAEGIGFFEPFFFERKGRRTDGSETRVAFTLAFALDAKIPDAAFFVCQQHFPQNFWDPGFQQHANGAADISAVTLTVPQPVAHDDFFAAFCGSNSRETQGGNLVFPLNGGRIIVARDTREMGSSSATPQLTSFSVRICDLSSQADRLRDAAIPFTAAGNRIVVPARAAFGVEVLFEH